MTSCARAALFIALLGSAVAQATTFTWNTGSGEWNTVGNWLPNNAVPGPGDTATFSNTTFGNPITVTITGSPASVAALTKSGAFTVNISGPQSLTIGAGGITRTGGGVNSVLNITTNVVVLAAGETWTISGSTNTFSGTISGANFTKAGGGILILSGNNTFSGARVNAGTLRAMSSGAFGAGTLTLAGGTLSIDSAGGLSLPIGVTTAGNATLNVQGGAVTHSVTSITDNAGNTLTLTTGAGASLGVGTLAVSGTVTGVTAVSVTGALTLAAAAGRLTTGGLTLTNTTNLNFTVGNTAPHVQVNGPLVLAGVLTVTSAAGFAAGTYNLMTATVSITDNKLSVPRASVPAGFNIGYRVAGANVNLIVTVRALGLTISKLAATYDSRHTQVAWSAQQEQDTVGYRLWRQGSSSRVRVGPDFLPGGALRMSTDLKNGPSYVLEDWSQPTGGTYWVEAIGIDGPSDWLGPVVATPGAVRSSSGPPPDPARMPVVLSRGSPLAQPVFRNGNAAVSFGAPSQSWSLAAAPGAKVSVRDPGVYRIGAQALFESGIPAGVPLDSLKVSSLGSPISFRALSADGAHLNAGDSIEFYGQGVDSRYTDSRVYWVTATLGAGPQTSQPAGTAGPNAGASFLETLQFQDRVNYFRSLKNGGQEKFFGPFVYNSPAVRVYSTPAIDLTSSEAPTLEVALQGITTGQHSVQVSLNGVALGVVTGSGQQKFIGTLQIPAGLLVAGNNTVELHTADGADESFEVYQRLTYPRLYQSSGSPLFFTAPGGSTVHLAGFAAGATSVLDITNEGAAASLKVTPDPADGSASLVTVPPGGQRSLYAYSEADLKSPVGIVANTPSSVHSGEADLVVIAHSTLLASAQPLVSQRQAEGLRVALVDVESLYDEFNYGQKDVSAIIDFLAYAQGKWSHPPAYALLVGSASYNPRNYGGTGGPDLVPTPLIETQSSETGSDDAVVSPSATGAPSLALGRFPLSDPDAVSHAVSKTVGRALVTSVSTMLFVHDEDDLISNFTQQTQYVRNGLWPWQASVLARANGLAEGSPQQAAADSALHDALLSALDGGPAVVSYLGHGNEDAWSGSILSGGDVPALSGSSGASFFVAGACLNGDYVDQGNEFLAGALLSAPNGGAWAMVASSASTNPGEQSALAENVLHAALFEGLTLGEALVEAKSGVADADLRATFELFGDPSARVVPPRAGSLAVKGLQSNAATGCGTPGSPLLAMLPLVALALLLKSRRRAAVRLRRR